MMQYDGKLFHIPSHRIVCNTRTRVPFCSIAGNSESCTVGLFMFSSLCWHISVHIDLVYGDRDNLILPFLIKLNK